MLIPTALPGMSLLGDRIVSDLIHGRFDSPAEWLASLSPDSPPPGTVEELIYSARLDEFSSAVANEAWEMWKQQAISRIVPSSANIAGAPIASDLSTRLRNALQTKLRGPSLTWDPVILQAAPQDWLQWQALGQKTARELLAHILTASLSSISIDQNQPIKSLGASPASCRRPGRWITKDRSAGAPSRGLAATRRRRSSLVPASVAAPPPVSG